MSEDEPRFTLAEAKVELAKRECATWGHRFEVWESERLRLGGRDVPPLGVQCLTCQRIWNIGEERA